MDKIRETTYKKYSQRQEGVFLSGPYVNLKVLAAAESAYAHDYGT